MSEGKSINEVFTDNPNAGNDPTKDMLVPVDLRDGTVVAYNRDQIASAVAETLNLGGNLPTPNAFSMSLPHGTLNAVVSPLTGVIYEYWIIQKDNATVPTGGGTQGTVPAQYPVGTVWDADMLLPHIFHLFVSSNDINYVEIGPPQTLTATTDQTVPQTPNDVNFPALTNVLANTAIESNAVQILGLLAPTTISVANGEYSKNGGTYTSAAGTIENSDTIRLRQTSSLSDDDTTTVTVSLGLRTELWSVTTAATGVNPGVISIVAATYSGAETGTITIDLARTGGSDGIVGCRVSTIYDPTHHTAEPGVNFVAKNAEVVTFADSDIAESVTITNIVEGSGILLDIVGELVIDSGSEFGGATIDPTLNATLFEVTGTGGVSAFQQQATGDHIIKVKYDDAIALGRVTNTPRDGGTWGNVPGNSGSMQALPVSDFNDTPGYSGAAQELSFDVDFVVTGTHYFWLDSMAVDGGQNSCWLGVDDNELGSHFGVVVSDGVYRYSDNSSGAHAIDIPTTGTHKISVWCREGGFNLTTIVVTDNPSYDAEVSGDAEGISAFSAASGGDNPNNPTEVQGPPPIVDDKTPDPFPFGELTDQLLNPSETTSPVVSNITPIAGINVPTEIYISADPSGTGEYRIDGGAWVNAAAAVGSIVAGQTVQCRLTMADVNSTTRTMALTIGTVTHEFKGTTKDSGFIVLTPRTTTYTITTNNEDIQDWDVQVASGDGIKISGGISGTKIRGNRISTPNGHAITNNGHGPIVDVEIHNNDVMNCYGDAVYIYVCDSANIYDNNGENIHTGVSIWNSRKGNITVTGNWFKNMFKRIGGVSTPNANGVSLPFCAGPNIEIAYNTIINEPGKSEVEDKINMYQSSGSSASPAWIHHNRLKGKSESLSDSTIIVGDQGGKYTIVEDNVFVNAGQSGSGIAGGDFHIYRRNKILCEPLYAFSDPSIGVSNVGVSPFYTWWLEGNAPPTTFVFEENDVTFWRAANYAGRGGGEYLQPFWFADTSWFGPQDIAGWSTNRFDDANSQPANLTEAEIWDPAWDDKPVRIT